MPRSPYNPCPGLLGLRQSPFPAMSVCQARRPMMYEHQIFIFLVDIFKKYASNWTILSKKVGKSMD